MPSSPARPAALFCPRASPSSSVTPFSLSCYRIFWDRNRVSQRRRGADVSTSGSGARGTVTVRTGVVPRFGDIEGRTVPSPPPQSSSSSSSMLKTGTFLKAYLAI
ncbi:hypothetical protein Fot_19516 [Forsythia ovata]|uniref:Uncharacterized protein n=1 Tax=Forsythia ovata TaxID=205694 RepID=A0ABD1VL86_9LAMI